MLYDSKKILFSALLICALKSKYVLFDIFYIIICITLHIGKYAKENFKKKILFFKITI